MALTAEEFIRRFLLHILPQGFMRIRHYGFLANRTKQKKLALCRAALDTSLPTPVLPETVAAFLLRVMGIEKDRCPVCQQGRPRLIACLSPTHPSRWGKDPRGPP